MADDHQLVAVRVSNIGRIKVGMNVAQSRRPLIRGASVSEAPAAKAAE